MPDTPVPTVEESGVGDVEMAHELAKIAERSFNQKVEVIVHEDIGMKFDGVDIEGLGKYAEKGLPVFIVKEDFSAFIPPARDVIHRARILDA